MWKWMAALAVGGIAMMPGEGRAFEVGFSQNGDLVDCSISANAYDNPNITQPDFFVTLQIYSSAPGSLHRANVRYARLPTDPPAPIETHNFDEAFLATCVGADVAEIENFSVQFDSGANFIEGSLIALSFDDSSNHYEVRMSGATTTNLTVEITPLNNGGEATATEQAVSAFLQTRATKLLANQPDLLGHLRNDFQGGFNADVTQSNGVFSLSADAGKGLWAEISGAWSEQGATDSAYVLGTVGAHARINPDLLIGGMLQFDYASDENGGAEIDGTGWLVGPYFAARHSTQPLYFTGRLLYGQTQNDITTGAATGSFDSERWLAQARVTGEVAQGVTTLFPYLDVAYTEDKQEAFTDSASTVTPAQSVAMSALSLGLDFRHPLAVQSGEMFLTGGLSGVWSDTSGSGTAAGNLPVGETGRGRAELGLDYQLHSLSQLTFSTFYDGLGQSDYESYGLTFRWNTEF